MMLLVFVASMVVVLIICVDMICVLIWNKAIIMKNPNAHGANCASMIQVMVKWSALAGMGDKAMEEEVTEFMNQLPQRDMQRLVWCTTLLMIGQFGDEQK